MTRLSLILGLAALALAPATAQAQARTGTGGDPGSTATAPNTSVVGRTMPPARGAGGDAEDRRERTPQEAQDDRISQGICIGCGPK